MLKGDHCRVLNGQSLAVFAPEGGTVGSGTPAFIELCTVPGKAKSDGFGVRVLFLLKAGRQTANEIHAMPPGLQGPTPPSGRGSVTVRQAETGKTAWRSPRHSWLAAKAHSVPVDRCLYEAPGPKKPLPSGAQ